MNYNFMFEIQIILEIKTKQKQKLLFFFFTILPEAALHTVLEILLYQLSVSSLV